MAKGKRVRQPWSADELFALLKEGDAFKIAVLGHSAMEHQIDDALRYAFPHGVPDEVLRQRFPVKLSLGVALGFIDAEDEPAFAALNTLRNQFAHGEMRELKRERAREIGAVCEPLLVKTSEDKPEAIRKQMRELDPAGVLRFVVLAALTVIMDGASDWLEKKREDERIVITQRTLKEIQERRRAAAEAREQAGKIDKATNADESDTPDTQQRR